MSTYAALEIGKRALLANNFGLDLTSNNIANANTEGYSRRQAITSEGMPYPKNQMFIGTGVSINSIRSFREEYLDREIRKANGTQASYTVDVALYNAMETILKEPTDFNLGASVDKLLNSFDELALQPESIGLRQILLEDAHTLAEKFNSAAQDISQLRSQTYDDIFQDVDKANQLISQIAGYNKAIAITKDKNGNEAMTYIDKRELAIEQLAKLANTTVTHEDNGSVNVFINGINVVTNETARTLRAVENIDPATGESTIQILQHDESKGFDIEVNPTAGTLGAHLKHYNITLDDADSSNGYSIMKQIDTFVGTLAEAINSLFRTGYGLNDTAAPPAGRELFDSTAGTITAASIKVSDSVKDPNDIPLSATPGTPGNSEIAQAISRISQDSSFLNNQTPSEFYANFLGKVSQMASDAVNGGKSIDLVVNQLNSQRDSVIGVNTDEEALNLIKFQKNFEAASRVIAVTSEILSTIINLGR